MLVNLSSAIFALAAAHVATPQSIPPTRYQASLTIIEQKGGDRTSVTAVNLIPLIDGPIVAGSTVVGAEALLSGNLRVDEAGRTAVADVTICHPRAEGCLEIARPSLAFAPGDAASFHIKAAEFEMTVELAPEAQ
jgi:hypothetical protein